MASPSDPLQRPAGPGPSAATPVPDTICPLPWLNLSTDVNGSSRPCCKFAQPSPESDYQLANLQTGDLDAVWNGEAMQRLRRDFREGAQPAECSSCWDEEAAGIPSFRQTYVADRGIHTPPDYDTLTPDHPVALDLKLTNACNLKCRICGPVASSLWLREELASAGEHADPYLVENKDYFRANKITHDPANLATFRRWLPHLDHLELTGGEPMLSKENREVLELIATEGRPERMTLLLTTNATVVDERMLDLLPAFGNVVVTLSVDDIGERFTYERSPGRWEEATGIMARYAAMTSERLHVGFNCSVSPFNVWYLPEMVDWLASTPELAAVHLNLNLVHYPRHYCIQVLPASVKDAVAAHLTQRLLADPEACPPGVAAQVAEVVEFLSGSRDDDAVQWQESLAVTRHRDEIRGERFVDVFPEWSQVLRAHDALGGVIEAVGGGDVPDDGTGGDPARGAPRTGTSWLRFPRRRRAAAG
ncbi:MAG: twitch domain-containing radical SAM protein [Acidimicrobiales bacterium]|nr:twitch domain-containing radical SAM protein [Acidimicrobiales bacterium]